VNVYKCTHLSSRNIRPLDQKQHIHDTNNYTMAMTMFFSFKVPNTETVFSYVTLTGSLKSRPIDISGQNCCM